MDDIRRRIMVEMGSDTQGVAPRLTEEIQKMKAMVSLTTEAFGSGNIAAAEYLEWMKSLIGIVNSLQKELKSVTEADEEWIRMQARLGEMQQQAAQQAIERGDTMTESYRRGLAAIQSHVEDLEAEVAAEKAASDASQAKIDLFNRLIGLRQVSRQEIDAETAALEKQAQAEAFVNQVIQEDISAETHRMGVSREREALVEQGIRSTRMLAQMMQGLGEADNYASQCEFAWIRASQEAGAAAGEVGQRFNNMSLQVINAGASYTRFNTQAVNASGAFVSGMNATQDRARQGSLAVLNLSYALQDLGQSGFGAVVNNIPLVTTGFARMGGMAVESAAMMAGGLMVIGTAADVLYKNWDKITGYFQVGIPRPILDSTEELTHHLKANKKEFEELMGKTRLTLIELDRYKKLEGEINEAEAKIAKDRKERQEEERLGKLKSEDTTKRVAGVEKAIAETPGSVGMNSYEASYGQLYQALINYGNKTGKNFDDPTGQNYDPDVASDQAKNVMRNILSGNKGDIQKYTAFMMANLPSGRATFARNLQDYSPETESSRKAEDDQMQQLIQRTNKEAQDKKRVDDAELNERKAEESKRLSDLTSGKWMPMKSILTEEALKAAAAGQNRSQIEAKMSADLQGRLASQGMEKAYTPRVAKQLATQATEAAFGKMMTHEAEPADAARMVLEEEEKERAEKAAKAKATADAKAQRQRALANRRGLASEFEMNTPLGHEDAMDAAAQVQSLLKRDPGLTTQAAMVHVLNQVLEHLLQVQAQNEAAFGYIGSATLQLDAIKAYQARLGNMGRQAGGRIMMGSGGVFPIQ